MFHIMFVATQKKRIGEQLNYFWNMCPKPFPWTENKRTFFQREVERTALGETLNIHIFLSLCDHRGNYFYEYKKHMLFFYFKGMFLEIVQNFA